MLLSRVAESVYWAGRYLERAQATARMVKVHTELFLDLPRSAGLGWSPLLAVTGTADEFVERHGTPTEEAVVRFLTTDPDNAGSVRASVVNARANVRVSRAVFPEAAWEVVNQLHHVVEERPADAVTRRTRLSWSDGVVRRCQLLTGLLDAVMSHDEAYSFLDVGRCVERADMTTRVLQVQNEILMAADVVESPYADVTWMGVLRSLDAHQMFRRTVRGGVSGPAALRFLLRDPQFPRSVEHCLTSIARSLLELPSCQEPMAACADVQTLLETAMVAHVPVDDLRQYVEELQVGIAGVHARLADTYFGGAPPAAPAPGPRVRQATTASTAPAVPAAPTGSGQSPA
jgi:uncharacterized alpha-E superfamily protein